MSIYWLSLMASHYVAMTMIKPLIFFSAVRTCKFVIFTALKLDVSAEVTRIKVSFRTLRAKIILFSAFFGNHISSSFVNFNWSFLWSWFRISWIFTICFAPPPSSFPDIHHCMILIIRFSHVEFIITIIDSIKKIQFVFVLAQRIIICKENIDSD